MSLQVGRAGLAESPRQVVEGDHARVSLLPEKRPDIRNDLNPVKPLEMLPQGAPPVAICQRTAILPSLLQRAVE